MRVSARLPERLTLAAILLGLVHLVDHVLRVDHSGWPFREVISPFTYSLAVWPLLLFALLAKNSSDWVRFAAIGSVAVFTNIAHLFWEPLSDKYHMWAFNRSAMERTADLHNMLGIESSVIGVASIALAVALNLLLVAATAAFFARARTRRI